MYNDFKWIMFIHIHSVLLLTSIERVVPKINIPPTVLELLAIDKDLEGKSHPFFKFKHYFFPFLCSGKVYMNQLYTDWDKPPFYLSNSKTQKHFFETLFSFVCMNGNTWHHLCRCVSLECNIGLKLDCRCLLR